MQAVHRHQALGERFGLIVFLAGLAILLAITDWLWRWDQLIYDAELSIWSRPPADNIVIVAVDEASLAEIGRWPWRRGIHAQFLDRLKSENPRAIALDIIFAEPNIHDPEGDAALARAIGESGRVVLPMLMEQASARSLPSETLPLPALADAAAGLGHVHVEIDPDGIARSVYLFGGLGGAHWPHLSAATLAVGRQDLAARASPRGSPMVWNRADHMLIPFAGSPGHYPRFSYAQLLKGEFLPGTFTDKFILVGITATGLGDALPTPMSGFSHAMPGIEINANVLDALQSNIRVQPVNQGWHILLSMLIAVSPVAFFLFLTPRNALLAVFLIVAGVLLASALMMWRLQIWFAPIAAVLPAALSYPLWSWRRLEHAVRYLNHELDELQAQRASLSIERPASLELAMSFLCKILPVQSWSVQREKLFNESDTGTARAAESAWWLEFDTLWCPIAEEFGGHWLRLTWNGDESPTARQWLVLDQLAIKFAPADISRSPAQEVLQARIDEIQTTARQLQELRSFVDDTLTNMADGVLVVDALGQILLSNARANWYLSGNDYATFEGRSLLDLLADIPIQDGSRWTQHIQATAVGHEHVQVTAQHRNGRDFLVQMAPLSRVERHNPGLIVNLSDISPLLVSERKRAELLNYLSHDLRSPLISVLALYQLATSSQSAEEIHGLIARMQVHTERTLELAEQFLQLARAESIDSLAFYEVDLMTVVQNACEQVWAQARQKGLKIVTTIEVEEAWVMGEGSLLERALVNLLTNAIKYSLPQTVINVALRQQGKHYCCSIADQGVGIEPHDLPRIFDRFERVGNDGEDGTGLGLVFVDVVATRHRGEITVESELHRGSEFCLLLPAIS
jgi:CHASE2 domain-containing sensor protein/signal transduction histidine kinase